MANAARLIVFEEYVDGLLADGPMDYREFHQRVNHDGYADCLGHTRTMARSGQVKFELVPIDGEMVHRVRKLEG
jgi:hypothetical protein